MAYHTCDVCNIERPVTKRFWMQSQVSSIASSGTATIGNYNSCRYCSLDCWVDPPTPAGALHPYACSICQVVRAPSRTYWMPSQLKSIRSHGTSVTAHHNCCRVCDPSCWTPNSGTDVFTPQNALTPPHSTPTPPWEPATTNLGRQLRAQSPNPPLPVPVPVSPWVVSPPVWRPLPSPSRPIIHPRPRWLTQIEIKDDILRIQNDVPAGLWDTLVQNLKKKELKELSWSGACLIPNTPMGREAITLSDGGTDIQWHWVHFHSAALRITNPNTPIFVDVGNLIYKQFLLEVWPTSRLWEYLSNQVTIGDVVEAAFGRIIIDWAEAISLGDPAPRFVDDPIFTRLARMSRICLAAYCDLHMYGIISFV